MDRSTWIFMFVFFLVFLSIFLMAVNRPWHEEFECVGLGDVLFDEKGDLECIYTDIIDNQYICYYCNKQMKVWVRE